MDFQNSKEYSFADILLNSNLEHFLILSEKKMLLQDTGFFSLINHILITMQAHTKEETSESNTVEIPLKYQSVDLNSAFGKCINF